MLDRLTKTLTAQGYPVASASMTMDGPEIRLAYAPSGQLVPDAVHTPWEPRETHPGQSVRVGTVERDGVLVWWESVVPYRKGVTA